MSTRFNAGDQSTDELQSRQDHLNNVVMQMALWMEDDGCDILHHQTDG
jgi:hypothetical protein